MSSGYCDAPFAMSISQLFFTEIGGNILHDDISGELR